MSEDMEVVEGRPHLPSAMTVFRNEHRAWIAQRADMDGVLYRLPTRILPALVQCVGLTNVHHQAERALDSLCTALHAVGIASTSEVRFRWLDPQLPPPNSALLESMRSFGWTAAHIRASRELILDANHVVDRVQGAAGRLICCPEFLQQRDQLRIGWRELAESSRPPLPLTRSRALTVAPSGYCTQPVDQGSLPFVQEFDAFCDRWRLVGMSTWNLPDVDGPKWDSPLAQAGLLPGTTVLDTPWHFPLQKADDVGGAHRTAHGADAAQHGIDDPASWQTYARLLQLDHWERTIRSRLIGRQPRHFVRGMENLLCELTNLELDRVHKLRKIRAALQSGRRRSLRGSR